jgi:hypothetical protein
MSERDMMGSLEDGLHGAEGLERRPAGRAGIRVLLQYGLHLLARKTTTAATNGPIVPVVPTVGPKAQQARA